MGVYKIEISNRTRSRLMSESRIRGLVRSVLRDKKIRTAELSVAIVGDKRMADLAEKFARRRYRTDVFAFDLGSGRRMVDGQIIVNGQLARELARKLKTDAAAELALYIVHGLLHLLGYDDHAPKAATAMHEQTRKYLTKLRFPQIPPMPQA